MAGETYAGPVCRCGSRATRRIEGKHLVRICSSCGGTFYFRLHDGLLIPYAKDVAESIDERRENPAPPESAQGDTRPPWAWAYPQGRPLRRKDEPAA